MKYWVVFLLLKGLVLANSYWTIDEYVTHNPEQKALMQSFNQIVQHKSKSLNMSHKKVKISMLYPGNQITDYWRRSQKSFEARLQELNIEYEIQSTFVDENNVKQLQTTLLNFLKQDVDYLIFTLNVDGHKKLISQLIHNKKPKVILQNITTPLKEWHNSQPFMYVGFDHIEGTKLLANYYKKNLKPNSSFMMLYHNEGYVSQMRGDSFINMTQSDFNLKGSYYTYVNKEVAKNIVQEYKQIDEIDFIYNCSTDIAIGASEALQALHKKKNVIINGWGGGSVELEMIENKTLDVTVMRMNDDNGVAMAEGIKLDIQNKPVPLIYSGEFKLVDTHTSKEQLESFKQRAFRYSQ
jgi:autoinducer 2-binding protein LuxP